MTDEHDDRTDRLAAVHYLPHHDQDGHAGDVTGRVLDAEVISEQEYQRRRPSQKDQALQRLAAYRQDVTVVLQVARTAATHRRTRTVGKALARNAYYPIAGAGVAAQRWRDTRGVGRYERMMRAAEAAGDRDLLLEWEARDVAEKQRRHQRVMDWVTSPARLVKAAVVAGFGLTGLLLALGVVLAIAHKDISEVIGPINTMIDAIAWLVWFVTAYGILLVSAVTGAGVAYLWYLGRAHTATQPAWLSGGPAADSGGGDVMDQLPDEGTIVNALRNLNIRGFNQALKEGWRLRFRQPPTIDGKGWRAQIDLPPSSPVEEIVKRKSMLAHNLMRYPIEVWPTEPQPSVLDLWVAKPGALSGPVDPWPLLADLDRATCDYFAGVPVGVTIRGDVVRGRLSGANYVMGGVMGSGKSTLAINLVLGSMLDPLVDIDIVVMAENADYEPMRPRLRSLVTGGGDDTVNACMALMRELYDELDVRGKALREHDERFVTRELAARDARLRPRLVIIDECQNFFIGEHGKAAIEVTSKVLSASRKYAMTLVFITPEPSKDALPRKIISIVTNKACYAIGDQIANDAVLGTGSYKAGVSAVGLEPKTEEGDGDVGTCMARGFMAKPGLLRCFYVPQADAHRVTQRAMQLLEQAQITVTPAALPTAHERDPLADIATVLGDQRRMLTQEVLQRLTERDRWYADWTFEKLTAFLTKHDAAPYKYHGTMHVKADLITEALTRRDDLGEWAEDEGDPAP
ncbi:zonular occludens toxin domain-containing protein [Kibdelosporangium phytohabitans]|uniref:Zona occludens toxin N-terminal domain-containing protein n=1 Tax=Kibdelosporangium phytohabitans TaxID=860235 RepID=A0A0N9HSJ4_9PSEU|nr:zonular occludens toxin domain-containing protein [Kibdelosporangium phytohabitans]ALG05782.1 hypothetical protein AOZ06_01550 [Kibdelosporangium phytohabitans]MBE1466213.1 S-DNA-T family DNA segregation ATPase FtsK/SpoIIIE [Kibdelosporangium phytohabitans]